MFRNVNKLLQNIKNILQIVTKMLQFLSYFVTIMQQLREKIN